MIHIAIFASGGGSNAEKIMQHFEKHPSIKVSLVVSNNPNAGVLAIAERFGVQVQVISKSEFKDEAILCNLLGKHDVDYVVLAGFLWLIPSFLVEKYENKILNIHPSLLPKFGGKGMYGHHVHEAVLRSSEPETGLTIHLVNNAYDEGQILFQAVCPVRPEMNAQDIANAVLTMEHTYYPIVIENYIKEQELH